MTREPTEAPVVAVVETTQPTPNPTKAPRPTPNPTNTPRPTPNPTKTSRPTPNPTNRPRPTPTPTRARTAWPTYDDVFEEVETLVDSVNKELRFRDAPCTAANPCGECVGDCNTDAQCAGSLQCFQRPGLTAIPGCQGRGDSGKDYCAMNNAVSTTPAPDRTPRPTPEGRRPTPNPTPPPFNTFATRAPSQAPRPTQNDKRPTPNPTPQPVFDSSAMLLQDRGDECSERRPCGECVGDCDNDSQCAGVLRCFFRINLEDVPGCAGRGTVGRDYCAFDKGTEIVNTNDNMITPGQGIKLLNSRRNECTESDPCEECQG